MVARFNGGAVPYFFVTLFLFSSMEVVSKPLMGIVDPFQLTCHRFGIGLLFLLAVLGARGRLRELGAMSRRDAGALALLGVLNTFLAMSLLQLAVRKGNAATAATIVSTNPLFVYLFALIAGEERFSWRRIAGIVAGLAGIALTMVGCDFCIDAGALAALGAALLFALYTLFNKPISRRVPPLAANIVSFAAGLVASAAFLVVSDIGLLPPREVFVTPALFLAFLYLGAAVTGIGYLTFLTTIGRLGPFAASVMFLLKPLLATALALVFLGERLPPLFWPGLVLVTVGSVLILRRNGMPPVKETGAG